MMMMMMMMDDYDVKENEHFLFVKFIGSRPGN
jgi:hypothetical protein